MNSTVIIMFGVLFVLFVMQFFGVKYQINNYKKAVKRVHQYGNVGIGQKKGGFSFGHLVLIACGSDGVIRYVEVMEGMTFLAQFRPKKSILQKEFVGAHISEFLDMFHSMNKKKQKKYKGYIQALDALDMRLYPEHWEVTGEQPAEQPIE